MTQFERMMAGLPYHGDDETRSIMMNTRKLLFEFNSTPPENTERKTEILRELLGKTGEKFYIEPPFRCDYGCNIELGENFYSNYNLIILDCTRVVFGDNVLVAPNVTIAAAGHPIHPDSRKKYEYGMPVRVGNNVWLGANVVICPGVTIGDGSVIGAGSVVTKDIPENVVAFGNPCKVYRKITDEDRKYYYKDRVFDVEDY
ncbi:MAG: sugar O-acetyltransferase [Ruminococcus sp.]|nr:sugar O-acetyltransferase [Oscillospiraceae bacterium]MBR2723848.1 sugar O-acetyltransferase [Ruminococcus sp.]